MTTHNLEFRHLDTVAARRGRDMCCQIIDNVTRLRAQGKLVSQVWISQHAHDSLLALFVVTCNMTDNVLPKTIAGVPMEVGMCGGNDYVIALSERPAMTIAEVMAACPPQYRDGFSSAVCHRDHYIVTHPELPPLSIDWGGKASRIELANG